MNRRTYWKKNLKYLTLLLIVWFVVGVMCTFVFAEYLNQFRIGGFPIGFWFSTQGAIITFVVLIFIYSMLMDRLDEKYNSEQ